LHRGLVWPSPIRDHKRVDVVSAQIARKTPRVGTLAYDFMPLARSVSDLP
jgi:hypothetical protein